MRTFQKPKIENTELLKQLEVSIFEKTNNLEKLDSLFKGKRDILEKEFESLKLEKKTEIDSLENMLGFKRQERIELEKPIETKMRVLNERESSLIVLEKSFTLKEVNLSKREEGLQIMISKVEDLSDSLGDKKLSLDIREKAVKAKENILRDHETEYLVKIDDFNIRSTAKDLEITRKLEYLSLRESQLKEKEDDIKRRELILEEEKSLIQSKRQALLVAIKTNAHNSPPERR